MNLTLWVILLMISGSESYFIAIALNRYRESGLTAGKTALMAVGYRESRGILLTFSAKLWFESIIYRE